jgi:hypothetical protein
VNDWLTLMQGALAGGVVGAFVSPYIAGRSDRRMARAKAREKLAEAENARRDELADFSRIAIELRTAAMISGAPRLIVEKYISVSDTYRDYVVLKFDPGKISRESQSRPENWPGFLNIDAVMVAGMLSKALWHPWTGRMLVRFRLRVKLGVWRRRVMLLLIQGLLVHYSNTGKIPDDDEMVILASYCYENLPRWSRSGIPIKSQIRQRFRRSTPDGKAAAVVTDD